VQDDARRCRFFYGPRKPEVFKKEWGWKILTRLGLLFGYIAWLLWAPAIYFFENRTRLFGFLAASLVLLIFWTVIDMVTRTKLDWKRAVWIPVNIVFIGLLGLLMVPSWASRGAVILLVVSAIDWLVADPFEGHV